MPKKNSNAPANGALKQSVESRYHERPLAPGALKLTQARQYLGGLSVPTMHRLIKRGLLRPCRNVRHLLFPVKELDRFLRE
jgi:helix-turn-helix protein